MIKHAGTVLFLIAFLSASISAQTPEDLEKKYGKPDKDGYQIDKTIRLKVSYDKNEKLQSAHFIEKYSFKEKKTVTALPTFDYKKILNRVFPDLKYGKLIRTGGPGHGDCYFRFTAEYELLTVSGGEEYCSYGGPYRKLSVVVKPKSLENRSEPKADLGMDQISQFQIRLQKPIYLVAFQSASWTLIHDYSDKKKIDKVLDDFAEIVEAIEKHKKGNSSALESLGGYESITGVFASWLESDEQCVRAFGATVIGITGDKSLAPMVSALLVDKELGEFETRYDRGRAAIALGFLDAREYAPRLAELLNSKGEFDRIGGLHGLALMKMKKYTSIIEALKNAESREVREAAKEALKILNVAK